MTDPKPVRRLDLRTGHVAIVFICGVILFAAFLPWAWASFEEISVSKRGIEGDGLFTLILASIVAGAQGLNIYGRIGCRPAAAVALICGMLVSAIGVVDWIDIEDREAMIISMSVGSGLVITTLAGFALTATGYFSHRGHFAVASPDPAPKPVASRLSETDPFGDRTLEP